MRYSASTQRKATGSIHAGEKCDIKCEKLVTLLYRERLDDSGYIFYLEKMVVLAG